MAIERRGQTNPMQLSDLISTEYKERATNKANLVIHNYINMLRGFLASFCRNMNDIALMSYSQLRSSYMLSTAYGNPVLDLGQVALKSRPDTLDWSNGKSRRRSRPVPAD
jgi:hypothetical protein